MEMAKSIGLKLKILRQNCYISEREPEDRVGIKFLIAG
jgi:hypothetical protein